MIKYAVVVVSFAGVLGAANPASADVCGDINTVYESSKNGYMAWRGTYDRDSEEYMSHFQLPNTSQCAIRTYGLDVPNFDCEWQMNSAEEMRSAYSALAALIQGCRIGGVKASSFDLKPRPIESKYRARSNLAGRKFNYDLGNSTFGIALNHATIIDKRRGTQSHEVSIGFELSND